VKYEDIGGLKNRSLRLKEEMDICGEGEVT